MAQPLVLPFRGEQFSFALNTKAAPEDPALVDLSCVIFNREGKFLDVVHAHKPTALMGAVVTAREPSMWPAECQAVPGDDVVHVLPKQLDPSAEVMVLVASCPTNPGKAQNLLSVPKLEAVVTYNEPDNHTALTQSVAHDLKPAAQAAADAGQGQSLIIAVVYLDQPGWTVKLDLTGSALPSWGLMLPDLQAAIVRVKQATGVDLDSARALLVAPPSDTAVLGFSRLYEDNELSAAASFRLPEATTVTKLRVDVGWKFWGKTPEDEIENTAVEFAIKFYNAAGEEVQSAGTNEREAQGVVVGRPEPEEEEEAGGEEERPEPEEQEGEGEGGGEEGDEGAEPKEPPPPPPEPAEDPYEFKQRDVAFIELGELPKEVRSFVVIISNYGGAGFLPLRHAGAKMLDISQGEEAAIPLAEWHHYSKFEQETDVTQVALLKVYKEYIDTAWNLWRGSGQPDVGSFVYGDPEAIKTAIKAAQEANKQFKAEEAAALAAAEESGDELTTELRESVWRYSVLGLAMGGGSLEDAEHDVKNNVLNFDGPLKSLTARSCDCARVQFGGEKPDTYFGGYVDDLKSGPGVYVFATGAFYVGEYKAGKREGKGIMLMPDGGLYEGEFAADRFHGQGQYRYPDGSVYTGSWGEGKKHGPGVYWDTRKGCLRGSWRKGTLVGTSVYDQPAIHYEGEFVAGVPAGPCHFTITSQRTLDMPKFAAAHILDNGPTLRGPGQYAIPAGSGDDPKLDEEGNPIEDPDKAPLPSFPKYEGLSFMSTGLPMSIAEVVFPPDEGKPVPVPGVACFSVALGLGEPTAA